MNTHYVGLERMYAAAPTNRTYSALRLTVSDGRAEVRLQATRDLHHTAGAMHGSHYFKLLDDAAFFAVNSLVPDVFVLTAQFSVQLFRPVVEGELRATGTVTKPGRTLFYAESVLVGPDGKELGRGHGSFGLSTMRLDAVAAYAQS